jgi:toxin FitB
VLDIHVISEAMRPAPDPRVQVWFARQNPEALHLAAPVVAELAEGIERLPRGWRKAALERWLNDLIDTDFAGRILPFEVADALLYGRLVATARAEGQTPKGSDAQIAAIARRHGMGVATRDVNHFAAFGIEIVDPWRAGMP